MKKPGKGTGKGTKRAQAGKLLNEGLRAQDDGRWEEALALYRASAEKDPTYFGPPLNIGLLYKWRRDWRPALDAFKEAFALVGKEEERASIAWNLGITASAIAAWADAFIAWKELGMPIREADDGSPALPIGSTPLRLAPSEDDKPGEIVWADRFDPVRARIESIPTPESGYGWHDVVLHDAEPLGKYHGTTLSVFAVLECLERAKYQTFLVSISASDAEDAKEELADVFAKVAKAEGLLDHIAVEDFTSSLELLHRGPSDFHPMSPPTSATEKTTARKIAIAARTTKDAVRLLDAWSRAGKGRSYVMPRDSP